MPLPRRRIAVLCLAAWLLPAAGATAHGVHVHGEAAAAHEHHVGHQVRHHARSGDEPADDHHPRHGRTLTANELLAALTHGHPHTGHTVPDHDHRVEIAPAFRLLRATPPQPRAWRGPAPLPAPTSPLPLSADVAQRRPARPSPVSLCSMLL